MKKKSVCFILFRRLLKIPTVFVLISFYEIRSRFLRIADNSTVKPRKSKFQGTEKYLTLDKHLIICFEKKNRKKLTAFRVVTWSSWP